MGSTLFSGGAARATGANRPAIKRCGSLGVGLTTALLAVVLSTTAARGSTAVWLGGAGPWTDEGFWSTDPFYPTNGSPAGAKYSVFIDGGKAGIASDVTLDIGAVIDNLTIDAGDTLEITAGGGLYIKTYAGAGTISNSGLIHLAPDGGGSLIIDGTGVPGTPTATLSGGGMILLSPGGSISAEGAATKLINSDNFIHGAGSIGVTLVNHGVISADDPAAMFDPAHAMTIGPGAGGVLNTPHGGPAMSGVIMASGGGVLKLLPGTYDNGSPALAGTIMASGFGSKVLLGSTAGGVTTIKGGTLMTDAGSEFVNVKTATLKDLTLSVASNYVQFDGTITNIEGTITNNGLITVSSTGFAGFADLVSDAGDVTLAGSGTVTLDGTSFAPPFAPNYVRVFGKIGSKLTVGPAQTIEGNGDFGDHAKVLSAILVNHGTITAKLPDAPLPLGSPRSTLTIFPADAGATNDGTMKAVDGAVLTISGGGAVTNTGGLIRVEGADPAYPLAPMDPLSRPSTIIVRENAVISGGTVEIAAFDPMHPGVGKIQLNNGTIHGGTLNNTIGGVIEMIAPSTANAIGGTLNNPVGGTVVVSDNSGLRLETGGTYNNAGMIAVNDNSALILEKDATYNNTGMITLSATANSSSLKLKGPAGAVTLSGGGNVHLLNSLNNTIFGLNADERLINQDNLIFGAGQIGMSAMSLTNRGVIQATGPFNPLIIQPNADGAITSGTMKASGAKLILIGNFTNFEGATNGTITSDGAASTVLLQTPGFPATNSTINGGLVLNVGTGAIELNDGVIHGGTLTNSNGGTITVVGGVFNKIGGTLNNPAATAVDPAGLITITSGTSLNLETGGTYNNAGIITIEDNAALHLETGATYNNSGSISLNGAPNMVSSLLIDGASDVTLTGGGLVTTNNTVDNTIGTAGGGNKRLINQDNTIQGAGFLGVGSMAITNRGLIQATVGGKPLVIQPNGNGIINRGTIQALAGPLTLMNANVTNFEGATDGLIHAVGTVTIMGSTVDGGTVDTAGAGAIITLAGATVHNGTIANVAGGLVTAVGPDNIIGGTVSNAGTLNVSPAAELHLETTGSYTNTGVITLSAVAGSNADLVLDGDGGSVTLSGGGAMTLTNAAENRVFGAFGNERLINLDNTISGAGNIGVGMMSLTNKGVITANAAAGLTIQPNLQGVANSGTIQAVGATLTLDGGAYANSTGTIQATGPLSVVKLTDQVVINQGTLRTTGAGVIANADSATLNGIRLDGVFGQGNGTTTFILGTIINDGSMNLIAAGVGANADLVLAGGDVTLSGAGVVSLSDNPGNRIFANGGLHRLTIDTNQTVKGSGEIGIGLMALTNQGSIIANQSTDLTIQANSAGFNNQGLLQAAAGSTLNVTAGYTQTAGDTNVDGTLNVSGGRLIASGGTLSGSGTINVTAGFNVTGTLTKLDSGTLNVSGPQTHSPGAVLEISGGTLNMMSDASGNLTINVDPSIVNFSASQHLAALNIGPGSTVNLASGGGLVLVTSGLSLDATAALDLTNNDLIVKATAGTRDAVLADVSSKIAAAYHGGLWDTAGITSSAAAEDATHLTALGVLLNANALGEPIYSAFDGQTIDANSVLTKYTYYGDANLSGAVDGTDYALIDNGFNFALSGWLNGDFNFDGHIDGSDYALIDNAFNFQGGPLTAGNGLDPVSVTSLQAVPEPGSIVLFVIGAVAIFFRSLRFAAASTDV